MLPSFFPHNQKSPISSSLTFRISIKQNYWEILTLRPSCFDFRTRKNFKEILFAIIDLSEPLRYEMQHILASNQFLGNDTWKSYHEFELFCYSECFYTSHHSWLQFHPPAFKGCGNYGALHWNASSQFWPLQHHRVGKQAGQHPLSGGLPHGTCKIPSK